MNYSMQVQASVFSNVELSIYDSQNSPQNQIKDIKSMIRNEVDIIIVSPLEPHLIVDVVKEAENRGIPVILLDRKINSNAYTAFLGADNLEVGRKAGDYIVSSAKEKLNIIEVKGGDKSTPAVERSLGFHQVIDNNSKINLLRSIDGSGDLAESFGPLLDSLGNQAIDFAYFFNDEMAMEGWKIAKAKGLENNIKFIGVDGLNGPDGGIQMVQDGVLEASLLYPTGGAEVVKLALKVLNGEEVAKNNLLSTTIIDQFNASILKDQLNRIHQQQIEIEDQVEIITKKEELFASQNMLVKALVVFLLIILSLTVYSVYSIRAIRKKNRQLEITNKKITVQRNQIEKIAEEIKITNEAKINFFTGLSHELKTPLTLILSSIESIDEMVRERGVRIGNEVELIQTNSNRLLRLINQLLDFRKNEEQKFQLKASRTNLFEFSLNIFKDFKREAKKRNIDFKLESNKQDLMLFLDRNLMDKVYFNLLSNAFKFTPDNGTITITILDDEEKGCVSVHIKDSGIGIPEKELKNVFEAFFKGSNNRKNSSGVGLHLSKQFIELHKGYINVNCLKGTEFIITLRKGKTHLNDDEITEEQDIIASNFLDLSPEYTNDDFFSVQGDTEKEKPSLLIVEDNKDLLMFLQKKLTAEYKIYFSDGTNAIEKAFDLIPDVIICDVNLPEMNGFEICKIIKEDLRTSHIPTVILTALSDKDSYLEGLQAGADLYLTKPFSYAVLSQSIKSLLYNRENLRYYYTNNIYKVRQTNSSGNLEQIFIGKLNEIIQNNIDNEDFSVENLADRLGMSRSQLYRKVKAILGMSISEYIIQFRLEIAKNMLSTSTLSISEIGYKSGFSSPNYFSTAFKKQYGSSPLSFRKVI
jgi:signal transduction histidine kinase/AraC-like DNA-binding protein